MTQIVQIAPIATRHRRAPVGAALVTAVLPLLLAALLGIPGTTARAATPPDLFLAATSQPPAAQLQAASLPSIPGFAAAQSARLNPAVASLLRTSPAGAPVQVSLTLPSGQLRTAWIDRRRVSGSGTLVCRGQVEGTANSVVILALSGDALAGSISIPGQGSFQIQQGAGNNQRILALDPAHTPSCGVHPDQEGAHMSGLQAASASLTGGIFQPTLDSFPLFQAAATSNAVIDLLVVYTAAARIGAGGTDGMNALIDVAVEEANLAFENSLVQAQLQLVHREEIDYQETGNISADLDNLEYEDHGLGGANDPMARVHQLRSLHRADVVSLITENTGGALGLANVMHELELSFSEKAFSVVQRQYANAYYVLAHEVGHNLGCQHDRASSSGSGCFDYSHAHLFMVEGLHYHTIMAYQPGLPTPHYSNPDVLFQGVPTGVAEGETNSANNAKTINLTAPLAAQFSSVLHTGTPPSLQLTAPTNGARVIAGNILVAADATDADGQVVEVKFKLNGTVLARVRTPPFSFLWTNASPGDYTLEAEATDDSGWETDSTRVSFRVLPAPPAFDVSATRPDATGGVLLRVRGSPGQGFRIDTSPDLTTWTPLTTNLLILDVIDLIDPDAAGFPARFYRILPDP